MSRPKRRDPLRNVVKPQVDKLEIRWLMSQAQALAGSRQARDLMAAEIERVGGTLGRTLTTEFVRWEARHTASSSGSSVAAVETFEAEKLTQGGFGPWGGLRLLVAMEAQGDHQFDALYQQLSSRFQRWSMVHPNQSRLTGINPVPVSTTGISIGTGAPASGGATTSAPAGVTLTHPGQQPGSGPSPDRSPPPPIVPVNVYGQYGYCCYATADGAASAPSGPGGSGGTSGSPPSASSPSPPPQTGVMESNANLITGEYLQNHQLVSYMSQGQSVGIDLQYTSLQAYPQPIISGSLQINTNTGSGAFTTSKFAMSVAGASEGSSINMTIALANALYNLQLPVTTGTSLSTGIAPATITFTMNLNAGGTATNNFSASAMIVNEASSHYGSGWSVGGLQQLTVGTAGQTLMISDGTDAPEEFTSTDGVHYVGFATDTSTLTYSSTTTHYTRTYHDGTVVTFGYNGQELSSADVNGNTTSYAYSTTGLSVGALSTITDPVGLITTLAYDSNGHLSTVTDPAGRVTSFTFDSSGNLTKIVDPDNATTQYGYNSNHEMTSETDPNNSTATIAYDSFGRMTTETLYDGTSQVRINSAQEQGLIAWGGSESTLPSTSSYAGSVTDPDGSTTTVLFDSLGGVIKNINGNNGTTYITRNSNDWPTVVTDPMGRTTSYAYNSTGDITSITRPDGSSETITYTDSLGVPTEIKDFNGNTTTYVLDSHGNVTQEQQPGGVNQSWTYNSAGQPLTYTDGNGKTTSMAYDSLGRLTTVTEPTAGSPTQLYTYDSAGDMTSVKDELGNITTYTFDAKGRVLTEQNPVQAAAGKDTAFTYDADGNLTALTDANGHATTYTYNARNELVSVRDPMNNLTTYLYDAAGNETGSVDPLGNRTTYTYDHDNNLITAQDALGTTTYIYDADDEQTGVTDPNGNTTTYGFNNLGEVTSVTLPGLSSPTSYTYDGNGNLLTVIDPSNHITTYIYNALNEETSATNADGDTTSYTYDGDGNVLTVTDGLGHPTSYAYDAMDREISVTQPTGGGTTTLTYDAAGDLMTVTDPDNNVTSYTYNAAHELATETSPTGGLTTYTFDLVGNLTQVVDPDGHTIQYTYDGDNRETLETWVNPLGGSALNLITYTYNADSELTAVSDDNSSYEYTYNAEGEVTSQGDVGSPHLPTVTLTYSYDPAGNETSLTDSLGGVVSYTYDVRNELTNETLSGSGISAEAVKFTYDNAGNMTGLTRYSNLAETTVVAATSYVYDSANQITGITDKNSGGTTLVSYAYTYDAASRVTQEVRNWNSGSTTDTLTYGYTNNDQLTSVSHTNSSFASESFTYDANGNQTGTGYTTTTGNEQTASPGYTYTYDADGNMITSTQTSSGNKWTYTYDYRNRMTGAVEKTSGGTVLAQATYTYDALDNRIGTNENGTQTWTLFDGSSPIIDFNSSGSLTMRYLNGPAGDVVDAVLARQTSGGTISWYLPDQLGTVRDLINNSGSIIDHVDYSAFGTVLGESSPSNGDRIMGFSGLERDSVTGLNPAVERVENPMTGRWGSQDPLGFKAGDMNVYRYVTNDPSSLMDASGLQESTVWVYGGFDFGGRRRPGQSRLQNSRIGWGFQANSNNWQGPSYYDPNGSLEDRTLPPGRGIFIPRPNPANPVGLRPVVGPPYYNPFVNNYVYPLYYPGHPYPVQGVRCDDNQIYPSINGIPYRALTSNKGANILLPPEPRTLAEQPPLYQSP